MIGRYWGHWGKRLYDIFPSFQREEIGLPVVSADPRALGSAVQYRVFTTDFDRVCDADSLPRRPLSVATAKLDEERWAASVVDEAAIDDWIARADMHLSAGDLATTLLVDHSGSMSDGNVVIALAAARTYASALLRLGVAHEVLGFTTRSWKGGHARSLWHANGGPIRPGRLCDLLHIIYSRPEDTTSDAFLRPMLNVDIFKENVDGEAVQWAATRLLARPMSRRLLIVLGDGVPSDSTTTRVNGLHYLSRHLDTVVGDIAAAGQIALGALIIGPDAVSHYPNSRAASTADEARGAVLDLLAQLGRSTPPTS